MGISFNLTRTTSTLCFIVDACTCQNLLCQNPLCKNPLRQNVDSVHICTLMDAQYINFSLYNYSYASSKLVYSIIWFHMYSVWSLPHFTYNFHKWVKKNIESEKEKKCKIYDTKKYDTKSMENKGEYKQSKICGLWVYSHDLLSMESLFCLQFSSDASSVRQSLFASRCSSVE